jgi:putative DNA primase/helicase
MVPFDYRPENPDPYLEDALKIELPQILNWCLDGASRWLANGRKLTIPDVVKIETDDYFSEMDISAQWVTDRCDIADGLSTHSMVLFKDWYDYLEAKGKHQSFLNSTRFGLEMARLSGKLGFNKTRPGSGTIYERIALKK